MAETYDQIEAQPFYTTQYQTYAADLAARSDWWRGAVLDLECGTGINTALVASLADRVVGCDVSPALVRKAHEKLSSSSGAWAVVADAAALPFPTRAFDSVLSYGEPLSHMTDPDAGVSELARVIRPGGRLVLSVDNEWNVRALHPRRLRAALSSRGGSVREWAFFDDQGGAVRLALRTFTHSKLSELLRRHGFALRDVVGIHVLTLLAPLPTDARGDGWRARWFQRLHRFDQRLARSWPWNRLGYSKMVAAERT